MTHMIYPTTNFKATEQLQIDRGEGVYVYDSEGRRYLEGMSGLWCTSLGYGNRELIDTASEQMAKLPYSHLFGGKTHAPAMELADRIADMVPVPDARCWGMAYRLDPAQSEAVLADLDYREKGGYRRLEVSLHFQDPGSPTGVTPTSALTWVASPT